MSTQETDQAPEMTVHDVLAARVYLPRFLQKCAARGVVPKTSDEVGGLLQVAQNIRLHEIKQAQMGSAQEAPVSFIEKAAAASSALLGDSDPDPSPYLRDPGVVAAFEAGGLPA